MKIAIRMDDITPDMDWGKFNRFKALLDAHHIAPLIGVVPRNKDEKLSLNPARDDFWDYVKSLRDRGWVIAMHGYKHRYTTKDPGLFPIGGKSRHFYGSVLDIANGIIRADQQTLFHQLIRNPGINRQVHHFCKVLFFQYKSSVGYKHLQYFALLRSNVAPAHQCQTVQLFRSAV